MPYNIEVSEDLTLSARAQRVLGQYFEPVGGSDTPDPVSTMTPLPEYAASGSLHQWAAPVYHGKDHAVQVIRDGIAAALRGERDFTIATPGDSKTEGTGNELNNAVDYSWPGQFMRLVGGVEGWITAHSTENGWDPRWTSTGFERASPNARLGVVSTGAGELTFDGDFKHTGLTFWVASASGTTATLTVDGGTPVTVPIPAGGTYTQIAAAVSGDKRRSYLLTVSGAAHVAGAVPTYAGPRLKIARVARGGSTAANWLAGAYTAAPATSLWDTMTAAVDPDAILIQLGTNSALDTTSLTSLWAQVAALGTPTVLIAPGGLGGDLGRYPVANYVPMWETYWAASADHGFSIIDFETVIGNTDEATAVGQMHDQVHENAQGYGAEAVAVHDVLA